MNPPLIKTSYVSGDKTKLIKWVLQGSTPDVDIDGESYSNNMPAQNYLSDQQIADVLTYVRSSFSNKASAIVPADVKTVRASLKWLFQLGNHKKNFMLTNMELELANMRHELANMRHELANIEHELVNLRVELANMRSELGFQPKKAAFTAKVCETVGPGL